VWQTVVAGEQREAALMSLAQASSNEFAARARVTSSDRVDLALMLATHSIDVARKNNVSWTEGASALRDIFSQTRGTREYCLQHGEGRSIDYSETVGLVAVATEGSAVCLFRRDEGALRLLDTLQSFSGAAVEELRFSADGEWLITHMRGGALRALPVGAIYKNKIAVQRGQANYQFETFGDTDIAKAVSFDANRSRVAFFSRTSQKIEMWGLLKLEPTVAPLATLDPGGHVLATAFDPSGAYLAALVLETERKQKATDVYQFWEPTKYDLREPPSFHVRIWSLSTFGSSADFAVLEQREGVYLGDSIVMGALRGGLRVGPEARWVAPAMFLADAHSLEPRMIAEVIHVADLKVIAKFMKGTADRSFDGWDQISDIGFTKDGRSFFALNDSVVRFWSLQASSSGDAGQQRLTQLITPSAPAGARKAQGVVSAISLSRDDKLLASLDSTGSLTVWDLSGAIIGSQSVPLMFVDGVNADASPSTPTALQFSDDGRVVFFAASGGEVRECDVRNRCGPIAPRRASAPLAGGQWKGLSAPAHGKWIAAVSDQQIVSFFRLGDLTTPFFQIPVSDKPAPVVSRGYAILSGTPGRPVSIVSSTDGSWAAVFERQQYGFNERLQLVHLTDQPAAHEVNLASGDCDGRFLNVQFDPFASYVVVLSKFGCIAFARLQDAGATPIVAEHPLHSHHSGLGVPSLTFTRHYISIGDEDREQLWGRDEQTGAPSRLLLDKSGGTLLLPINEKEVIFAEKGQVNTAEALKHYQLTAEGVLGPPIPIGSYTSVKRIALGGALATVIGTRNGTPQETVAVWPLASSIEPLIERPSNFTGSNPRIVFDSTSKRVLVGPSSYSLKDSRPESRTETTMLLDFSRNEPRYQLINIDLGDQKEECKSDMKSCYELDYSFSPDGAWLGVSRPQSFGPHGPASIWLLGMHPAPRLNFPAGTSIQHRIG
jgi:WD40 repeat protein